MLNINPLGAKLSKVVNSLYKLGEQVAVIKQKANSHEDDVSDLVKRVKVLKKENGLKTPRTEASALTYASSLRGPRLMMSSAS